MAPEPPNHPDAPHGAPLENSLPPAGDASVHAVPPTPASANAAHSGPQISENQRRLDEAVTRFEAEMAVRRTAKPRTERQAPRCEGVYMLLFEAFLVFMLGGMNEYVGSVPPMLRARGGFFEERMTDLTGISRGFLAHAADLWYLDLCLLLTVGLAAFGVRDARKKRRYFMGAVFVTVAIFAAMMMAQTLSMMKPVAV